MSETDDTGYHESPDTTEGPVQQDQSDAGDGEATDVALTTDEESQRDDSVMRPGNQAG